MVMVSVYNGEREGGDVSAILMAFQHYFTSNQSLTTIFEEVNGEHNGNEEEENKDILCDISLHPKAPMGIIAAIG